MMHSMVTLILVEKSTVPDGLMVTMTSSLPVPITLDSCSLTRYTCGTQMRSRSRVSPITLVMAGAVAEKARRGSFHR